MITERALQVNVFSGKLFAVSGTMKSTHKNTKPSGPHVLVLLGYNEQDLLRGIFSYAKEARWTLDTNYNRIGLTPASGEQFSGIIALIGKKQELDVLRRFPGVPCVDLSGAWLWDLKAKGATSVGRVAYDPAVLGRTAAAHLLDQGLRHLVFINTCNGWHERPAVGAVAAEATRRGASFHEIPLYQAIAAHAPYSATRHSSAAMRWLARTLRNLPKPCGVVVADDWAPHLLRVCERAGIAVPTDLAIMGMFNHLDACEYASVPVSSVDANFERIAREGTRLLGRLMAGEAVPAKPILIPPRGVVVRQSTSKLAVSHRETAKAAHFIQKHFREPLSVEKVAAAAGLSRRGLTVAFRRELGESVARYIARLRAEEAVRLLCETDLKATDIAEQTGFGSLEHLSRAFKRATGLPPAVYRQQHRRNPIR
ncbi:MAG: substrate-binding domain-containing protein [Kiritimatiellales bacterium]|jgi:LacI family transcriptional regulator